MPSWLAVDPVFTEAKFWCYARSLHPRDYNRWPAEIRAVFDSRYRYEKLPVDPLELDDPAQKLIASVERLPVLTGTIRRIEYASDVRAYLIGCGSVSPDDLRQRAAEWWIIRFETGVTPVRPISRTVELSTEKKRMLVILWSDNEDLIEAKVLELREPWRVEWRAGECEYVQLC